MGLIGKMATKKLMEKVSDNKDEQKAKTDETTTNKQSKKLQQVSTPAEDKGLIGALNRTADQLEAAMFNETPEQVHARRVREAEGVSGNIQSFSKDASLSK